MKFTLSWLHTHLETSASLQEILDALTDLGLEVETVENPAARLADFTLGYVQDAQPHPDADRLRVCQVETDEGLKQIVCGAANARKGITVVIAKPGMYIPGIDTTIQIGKIRGVESHGMMCSEREMEMSDEHDGIIELPSGKVGQRFVDWLTAHSPERIDPVIDIAITPNRPDALGIHGIARDLAARGIGHLKALPKIQIAGEFPSPIKVTIDPKTQEKNCPVFYGRMIKGVKNGPSPQWLQRQLKAIGLRPISALVDITNFFTIDQNRPLHVFDADKLQGDLHIHATIGGEEMPALDDKTYCLPKGATVISDRAGIQSLAGIVGGAATGCDDTTQNIFLEAAFFDPIQTAMTGRALRVHSDARYRFERGIDPHSAATGIEAATQMILDLCGGTPSQSVIAGQDPDMSRSYVLDPTRCIRLVGMDVDTQTQHRILNDLGFVQGETIEGQTCFHVPSWRPDIKGEADLVEEIVRVVSLGNLQGQALPRQKDGIPRPVMTPLQKRATLTRRQLAGLGYNECITYSFIDQDSAALFGADCEAVCLTNPISSEMTHMRPDLLPGLLQAASRNQARGFLDLTLFEVGPIFAGGEPGEQQLVATAIQVGHNTTRNLHEMRRGVDVFDAKEDALWVLDALNAPEKTTTLRDLPTFWHPGRSGRLALGQKTPLADFGELHPRLLEQYDIKGPVVAFTIYIENLPYPHKKTITRNALNNSAYQTVERDFAFVLDKDIAAQSVLNAAKAADKKLIEEAYIFDVFEGTKAEGQIGEGKKSLALSIRLKPLDHTLKEEEIDKVCQQVIDKVHKATGGVLRC